MLLLVCRWFVAECHPEQPPLPFLCESWQGLTRVPKCSESPWISVLQQGTWCPGSDKSRTGLDTLSFHLCWGFVSPSYGGSSCSFLSSWVVISPVLRKKQAGFPLWVGTGTEGWAWPIMSEKIRFTLLLKSSPVSETRTRSKALLSFNPTQSFKNRSDLPSCPWPTQVSEWHG